MARAAGRRTPHDRTVGRRDGPADAGWTRAGVDGRTAGRTGRPARPERPPRPRSPAGRVGRPMVARRRARPCGWTARRPSRCPASAGRRSAPAAPPLLVAAGFATLWAALLSYLPVAAVIGLARTLEGAGGLGGAARGRAGRLAARPRRAARHLDRPARARAAAAHPAGRLAAEPGRPARHPGDRRAAAAARRATRCWSRGAVGLCYAAARRRSPRCSISRTRHGRSRPAGPR